MTSKERILNALQYDTVDYIPCSFMQFYSLYGKCATEQQFIERQLSMDLDPFVHVGHLNHSFHPDVSYREWAEHKNGKKIYCRRIDTPKGALTGRVVQVEGWPQDNDFPLFDDRIVPRAQEVLVKPEQDLDKLPYIFDGFKDDDIENLRESAKEAKRLAENYSLVQMGGWKGSRGPGDYTQLGVMGVDALSWLSGFENVMALALLKPEVIEEYAKLIHEWNMKQIEIYLDVTEADILQKRAWYETTEFWTPQTYRQIIAPFLKKEVEAVHQAGKKFAYIITSAFRPILDDILHADIDVLVGIDPVEGKGTDMRLTKEKFTKKRKALWGGINAFITLETGSEQQIKESTKQALAVLGEGGGFVLSPVDNVYEDDQKVWQNIDVFINTWKRYR